MKTNAQIVPRILLTALLLAYFLIPFRLPVIGFTPHGLLLLCAMLYYVFTDVRRSDMRQYWPFAMLLVSLGISFIWASGGAEIGTVRAVGFGVTAAFLVSRYLPGDSSIRVLQLLGWIVAGSSVVVTGLYVAATFGAPVAVFDPFTVFGVSGYHSGLFFLVAIPIVWFVSARIGMGTPFLLLLPLWMALMISGFRGLWVGALAAVLMFGLASKRIWQTAAACGIAVVALTLTMFLTERYLGQLNRAELLRAQPPTTSEVLRPEAPKPVAATPLVDDRSPEQREQQQRGNKFAPASDLSAPTLAAANLAAKTRGTSGLVKVVEELSTSGRLGYWLAGFRMWSMSPILGVGPGNFAANSEAFYVGSGAHRDAEKAFDAHNMFVATLAELGVVGFASLVTLVVIPGRRWFRCLGEQPTQRDWLSLVGAVFVGLTVVGMTWDIHMQRLWWIGLGLLWAATLPRELSADAEDTR